MGGRNTNSNNPSAAGKTAIFASQTSVEDQENTEGRESKSPKFVQINLKMFNNYLAGGSNNIVSSKPSSQMVTTEAQPQHLSSLRPAQPAH